MSLNAACALGAVLLAIFMREKLRRANKKLDIEEEALDTAVQEQVLSNDEERRTAFRTFRFVT